MEEIYLTVKQIAEIKGCTERYIQSCINKGKIVAEVITGLSTGRGGIEYRIPLSKLDEKVQLKYKRYLKSCKKKQKNRLKSKKQRNRKARQQQI